MTKSSVWSVWKVIGFDQTQSMKEECRRAVISQNVSLCCCILCRHQSIDHSINQSTNQSIDWLTDQLTMHSIIESTSASEWWAFLGIGRHPIFADTRISPLVLKHSGTGWVGGSGYFAHEQCLPSFISGNVIATLSMTECRQQLYWQQKLPYTTWRIAPILETLSRSYLSDKFAIWL